MSERMAYMLREACGCVQTIMADDSHSPETRREIARKISAGLRRGGQVERVSSDVAVAAFCTKPHTKRGGCPCRPAEDKP